jgi:glycine/D-amino acid oxidase-like deaminating enzyme
MPHDRVLVAGAGIVGASFAYHLAKRGAQVTVLERSQPAAGASGKSFGWLNATFSKRPRAYFKLNHLGMVGWRRLESELNGALQIQWGGSVAWFPPGLDSDELRAAVESHRQWGYAARCINEPQLRSLLPPISPGPIGVACHAGLEGAVDPAQAVTALLSKAQEFGAELLCRCEVTGFELERNRVQTSQGPMESDTVVLACGVDSQRLAKLAGVNVPLKDSPGVLVHTAPMPRLIDRIILAPGVHFKQQLDGTIVAGGQIVAGVGTAATPFAGAAEILANAVRFLPQLRDAVVDKVTLGYRVMPEDEYPIVGFSTKWPNVYIAATHSGVTLAPVIGELAAREILDHCPVTLLDNYRPSRFE